MKNDLKRFEIADAQADCTVAGLAGSFHPLAGVFGQRGGGTEGWRAGGWRGGVRAPFWTVGLSSNSCASLTRRRQQHWDRWTGPAPPPLSPPTTASLIKNTSLPLLMCGAECMYMCIHVEVVA